MMLRMMIGLFYCLLLASAVLGCDQDFISIDCGINKDDQWNIYGMKYVEDDSFVDTGVNKNISRYLESYLESYFISYSAGVYFDLRSFPDGGRNCYTLNPLEGKGHKYLVRAYFMYGNYDDKKELPEFDLYLGVNFWERVKLLNASQTLRTEIITWAATDFISVCLVNTGHGTPFISAIELRLLQDSIYNAANESWYLMLKERIDLGLQTNLEVRYVDDIYDRIWSPEKPSSSCSLGAHKINENKDKGDIVEDPDFQAPSKVMLTAITPINGGDSLGISCSMEEGNGFQEQEQEQEQEQYHIMMHFADVEEMEGNQSRKFNIYLNGEIRESSLVPYYRAARTVHISGPLKSGGERYELRMNKTRDSTHPPIINALELYIGKKISVSATHDQDADAMMKIKKKYGVRRNWMGDPCVPKIYSWVGLNCSNSSNHRPRIVSLNLASNGLRGEITDFIANLTAIQSLDLSRNNLTGEIPDFLAKLPFLSSLNLTSNQLKGYIPQALLERSNKGSLNLSVDDNPELLHKRNRDIIPLIIVPSLFAALGITLFTGWVLPRRKRGGFLRPEIRYFTYEEMVRITNNFEKVLGKGGYGSVYYGCMEDGTQVAVKTLNPSSVKKKSRPPKGSKELQTEARLLMKIHHKNLVSLIGYCDEDEHMVLVYEYMAQGNLEEHLTAKDGYLKGLTWRERLQIALDAAQGLEYLHNGCKPPIIHRDVKPMNILLNERLEAKVADFGLSKIHPNEELNCESTSVKGTLGYLDPEYYVTSKLTEKSDVYSFGIILLRLVTGQPVVISCSDWEKEHIVHWVIPMLEVSDITKIVDPILQGDYDIDSVHKTIEIAMRCTTAKSEQRPTMNDVILVLKECLGTEKAQDKTMSLMTDVPEIGSSSSFNLSSI